MADHPDKLDEAFKGQFEDYTIDQVTESDDGWSVQTTSSTGFFLNKEHGVEPKPGQSLRLFTHQGSMIHGIDIDGRQVFYQDKSEQEAERQQRIDDQRSKNIAEYEEKKDEWAAAWAALPREYQDRAANFNERNPEWHFEFQSYELFCCVEGHKMAGVFRKHMADTGEDLDTTISWWQNLPTSVQMKLGDLNDDHSGNTFGFATRIAYWEVAEPANIVREHGAIATLVGCDGYGCHGPDDFPAK